MDTKKLLVKRFFAGAYFISGNLPLSFLLKNAGGGPLVLFYHAVSDYPLPHIENLYRIKNVREFEADLDYLLREFRPIGLDDLKSSILAGGSIPERAFYLTFDDGLREMAEIVAPILKRKGLHATFFISSGFLNNQDLSYRFKVSLLIGRIRAQGVTTRGKKELQKLLSSVTLPWTGNIDNDLNNVDYKRHWLLDEAASILNYDFHDYLKNSKPYMGVDQIRTLVQEGFAIGSHSIDHPNYSELNLEEQLQQTRVGSQHLTKQVGVDHKLFAFPFSEQGVSNDFYKRLVDDGTVQLFFGTSGWAHLPENHLV